MNTIKKLALQRYAAIAVAVAVVAAVGTVAYAYTNNSETQPRIVAEGNINIENYNESDGMSGPSESLGALTSPDIASQHISVNGIPSYYLQDSFNTATTTLCALENPSPATSSVSMLSYQIGTGTSTASTIVGSVSTGQYATSSSSNFLDAQTVGSGEKDDTYWFNSGTDTDALVGPDEYVLLMTEGPGSGGYTYGNTKCNAVFQAYSY